MTSTNLTDKDVVILSFFFKNGNKPTHATGIAKSGKISKRWSGKRCEYLESVGILSHTMIKPPRQKSETEYYSILDTITALSGVMFNLYHRHDARKEFMKSAYYHNCIPKLAHWFNETVSAYETLNDAGLEAIEQMSTQNLRDYGVESGMELCTKLVTDREFKDTYDFKRHTLAAMDIFNNPKVNQTGEMALNDDEVKRLESSLKHNWLALKYVVSFLLADPQMQRQMYVNMIEDSKNVLTLTDGDLIRFFNQLDQLNFNYGFLFD